MKIAVLVYRLTSIGGVAKHALLLSREFVAMGHEVTVWAIELDKERCYPEITRDLDCRGLRSGPAHEVGVSRKLCGKGISLYLRTLWRFYQEQRRLSLLIPDGYDVVNPHGHPILWTAKEYVRRQNTPVVWLCNDFAPMASHRYEVIGSARDRIEHAAKTVLCAPFERYDRAAVRETDQIVVLSDQVKTRMKQHHGVDASIVRAGVDAARFCAGNRRKIRERFRLPDTSFVLLTVCVLMPRRRLEDIIRAVRILREQGLDVKYLVVGRMTHSPAYTELVQAEVAACQLAEHVQFCGEVSESDLPDYYHACDAFVWAADENQSWGLVGMEAMAARRPLIVSKANGLAEVLDDGRTALIVPPCSPAAIASAISGLMRDPALADRVAADGQRLVRDQYSWRRNAESMLNLFGQAVVNKGQSRCRSN